MPPCIGVMDKTNKVSKSEAKCRRLRPHLDLNSNLHMDSLTISGSFIGVHRKPGSVPRTQREEKKVHENGFGYANAASLMRYAQERNERRRHETFRLELLEVGMLQPTEISRNVLLLKPVFHPRIAVSTVVPILM